MSMGYLRTNVVKPPPPSAALTAASCRFRIIAPVPPQAGSVIYRFGSSVSCRPTANVRIDNSASFTCVAQNRGTSCRRLAPAKASDNRRTITNRLWSNWSYVVKFWTAKAINITCPVAAHFVPPMLAEPPAGMRLGVGLAVFLGNTSQKGQGAFGAMRLTIS